MAKLTITDIASGYASTTALNTAFTAIEAALENTLSRDGTSPNQMGANLDMNGFSILNQKASSGNENFVWMGTWVSGTTYAVNNLVYAPEGTELGNGLICTVAHTAGATLDGDAANWDVYVQKGAAVGGIAGPLSSTVNYLSQWSDTTGTTLKNGVPIGSSGGVQAWDAQLDVFATKTFVDEDNMVSNLDTAVPSQQSVKAYVDNVVSNATTATPDKSADYFLFEDSTDTTQKKALLSELGGITLATAQATISGTVKDFVIPAGVKRITVIFNAVSTNSTSALLVQVGTGGVPTTSGYVGQANYVAATQLMSTGFMVQGNMVVANNNMGSVTIQTVGSNIWVESGIVEQSQANYGTYSGGVVTLAGTLDFVRITTVSGDTFDNGSVAVSYE